ncbi:PREDICTED: cytochrome b-c1 complex subunit 7-like [Wasmannia auropunctata]|uniref:cytochrome b-c1 complex subunit 7-like n=1 Tax=Wasmannia auropunctata TaxID=64793 RepID=UPI0005F02C8F|nr:PREDICTED: cytochrome b-c1 complex subunit 7-like [Wasmannia auropunctata]
MKFPSTLFKNLKLSKRNFAQNQHGSGKSWEFTLKELAFNLSGYNKYGLYTHDILIPFDDPIVVEALHRLPEEVLDARNFRIIRASQLSFLKIYLPRKKWVTYEQDKEYRYLTPYIEEIQAEEAEIDKFDYD